MTIIQKLITKFKSLFKTRKTDKESVNAEVQLETQQTSPEQTVESRKANYGSYYYSPKTRGNALEFQDNVNNELFWDGN